MPPAIAGEVVAPAPPSPGGPSAAPPPAGPHDGLRDGLDRLLGDLAAGRSERSAARLAALDAFLEEQDVRAALAAWTGAAVELPAAAARLEALLNRDIAEIDRWIGEQVDAILHAARFQALEASWRGVAYLLRAAEGAANVKIKILCLTWSELLRDLERAPDFDQSELFNKIYSDEFGMPGGEPYGLLVGDYFVSHRRTREHPTDDVTALKGMAQIAAAAFAPFVVGAEASLFGLESFRDFGADIDFDAIFQQAEYLRWRALRALEDTRFLGICLPRILMRPPWRDVPGIRRGFRYLEACEAADGRGYLWGNAAFAFASVAIRAFKHSGWFAEIRGAPRDEPGSGLVADLGYDAFSTDRPSIAFKAPVEVALLDRQERVLSGLGFIPLSPTELAPYAVFYSNQSIQLPQIYSSAVATINARLSAMLQYMLCVGRFAHVIKVIGRDRIGSFSTAEECQSRLRDWVSEYVTANPSASLELRIRHPLREARVTVTEQPGKPGSFRTDIHLRPHLQLDDISTGIRLTTELAPRRTA